MLFLGVIWLLKGVCEIKKDNFAKLINKINTGIML